MFNGVDGWEVRVNMTDFGEEGKAEPDQSLAFIWQYVVQDPYEATEHADFLEGDNILSFSPGHFSAPGEIRITHVLSVSGLFSYNDVQDSTWEYYPEEPNMHGYATGRLGFRRNEFGTYNLCRINVD